MSMHGEQIYCAARPIIGLCRADIETEFGNPTSVTSVQSDKLVFSAPVNFAIPIDAADISVKEDEMIAMYGSPKPGPDYRLYVEYLSGIAHEIGITLCGGIPFPEEFIKYWLDRNADASDAAYPWKLPQKPLDGVQFWVREDKTLVFVTAEYKYEPNTTGFVMRFKTERMYD